MYKYILFILCFFMVSNVEAQEDAWVYLTDKENVASAITNPETILTQRAIERKERHGIAIDERDVPLNESFKSQISNMSGISVLAKSKWMNALHVRGQYEDISNLLDLDFVKSIDFANQALNDSRTRQIGEILDPENVDVEFTYGATKNQVEMLHTNDLHLADYTGEGITIAVMDSGFPNVESMGAFARMRSNGDYLGGYDFHDRTTNVTAYSGGDHGTKVLSTMGGYIENQYVGTAPDASYYLFRTEVDDFENPVEESYWVEAAERADSLGVDIINTSLGYHKFDDSSYDYSQSDMNGQTTFISRGANLASEKGILVVTSAGNLGNDSWGIVSAPADAIGSFSIGAVTSSGEYASFSSRGSSIQPTLKPDVVAQGSPANVVNSNNIIVSNNGTSFSGPIVAGSLASLWQSNPDATAEEIKAIVRESASQFDAPDYFLGYGIPNFLGALEALNYEDFNAQKFQVYPNPASTNLYFKGIDSMESLDISIFTPSGKLVQSNIEINTTNSLDISALSSGLYLIIIESQSSINLYKFIKR